MNGELSYVDLEASLVPMALRDLHSAMPVGAVAHLRLSGAGPEARAYPAGSGQLLADLFTGAGFAIDQLDTADGRHPAGTREPGPGGELPDVVATVRRIDTLADTVGPDMRLLLVGLNPSPRAAASGVGFAGPSNRGWPALLGSGLATRDRDPDSLLSDRRIGMTDLVKRITRRASELHAEEYLRGLARLERLCAWLQPRAVCVVGLTGWRSAVDRHASPGRQHADLGGRPVWLMPNPSGLNAHVTLDGLCDHLRSAAQLADDSR